METLTTVQKSWGREEIIYNDEYCCKLLVYDKLGIASSLHYHKTKTETFVVTSGSFRIEIGNLEKPVQTSEIYRPGDSITLPPGTTHRVRCLQAGVIVECSTR